MAEKATSKEEVSELSSRVDELNAKLDKLNDKLDKNQANTDAIIAQQTAVLANTNTVKSQEIVRQTVSDPTGFIAKEIVNFVLKTLEKNQKSKTQQWFATKGRGVVEKAIAFYISQRLPQMSWYGTSVTGTQSQEKYHVMTSTAFPVNINTGVPFIGNVALTRVVLNVEADVNTRTNETSNIKCHLSNDQMNRDLWDSIHEDLVNLLKPHKTLWSIVHPIGVGIQKLYDFMKRETNFSIPFLVLFLLTLFIYPQIPPAMNIWRAFGFTVLNFGLFGIRPINILFGLINGIIWGAAIWLIIRFKLLPGLGKVLHFIRAKVFPAIGRWFMHPYRRWGTIGVVVVAVVFIVLWKVGVFQPPPALQLVSAGVPNGRVGTPYKTVFASVGGKGPYTWAVTSNVSAGLAFDPATATLAGTPTIAGSFPLSLQVTDSSDKKTTVTKDISVNLAKAEELIIVNTTLLNGKMGVKYEAKINVMGGTAPYKWGLINNLPPGLTLSSAGTISGIPTTAGSYSFVVAVDESSSNKMSFNQAYTLKIE